MCGTGLGMAIAAGRYPDVRVVPVSDCFSARMAEDFEGGRYAERLEMMKGGYEGVYRE